MYVLRVCAYPGVTQDTFLRFFLIHPSNVTVSYTHLDVYKRQMHGKVAETGGGHFLPGDIKQEDRKSVV